MCNVTDEVIYVIDFEGNRRNGIREYGCVEINNFEVTNTRTELVSNENMHDVLMYFVACRSNGSLAAHESKVEDSLLRNLCPLPKLNENINWGPWIDSKKLYRKLFQNMVDFSLRNLIMKFELFDELNSMANDFCKKDMTTFHCALYDAIASALLLKNIKKIFAEKDMNLSTKELLFLSNS